jgi:predicted permease
MGNLLQDFRHGLRMLMRSPGFTIVAVLTLALGIGANTAIFSVVNGVLLRPLGFPEPERLVHLWELSDQGSPMSVPEANFYDWQREARSFERMALHSAIGAVVLTNGQAVRVRAAVVSKGFFDVLKLRPHLGRFLGEEDHRSGAAPAAVVSYNFWLANLGGNPDLSKLSLQYSNTSVPVIGVAAPGFDYPQKSNVWASREALRGPVNPSRSAHNYRVVARLKPGVTVQQARGEIGAITRRIRREFGAGKVTAVDAAVVPMLDDMTSNVRQGLLVLMGAVGLLLLIACANVANLLLAQATSRQKELAVRAALGAGRMRLAQQFVTESLVLTVTGGALGVLLAVWGTDAMLSMAANVLPRIDAVGLDAAVLGFSLAVSVAMAFVLGLIPVLRLGRSSLQDVVKETGRSLTSSPRQKLARDGLVVAQVALTLVLLIGSGLLARSFWRLLQVDLGFQTANRLTADLLLPSVDGKERDQRVASFHLQLNQRVAALPGIVAAGATQALPLAGGGPNGSFLHENKQPSATWPDYRVVTRGYFKALGIPMISGRGFETADGAGTPHVAVISQKAAEANWPGRNPIGQRINWGNMDGYFNDVITIVGVVADIRHRGPAEESSGTMYLLAEQRPSVTERMTLVVHTQGDPAAVAPSLRSQVQSLWPEATLTFRTFDEVYSRSLADRRFNLTLLGVFAGTALSLAVLGIYGVISYSVAQRTQEIGIRMALGAAPRDVLGMVLRHGGALAGIGVALGLAGAWGASRFIATLLTGIRPTDLLTYAGVSLLLAAIALAAAFVPARRAARVDPRVALRYE